MANNRQSRRRSHETRPRRRAACFVLEALEERRLLATDSWTSALSGSWNNASNWSTGSVPQPGDDVVIDVANADPTVTFTSGVSGAYQSLTVKDTLEVASGNLGTDAGTISGGLILDGGEIDGSITLAGTTNWTHGGFGGAGTVTNTGTINLTGTSQTYVAASSTLDNQGQFNLGGTLGGAGNLTNSAGATIDFTATGEVNGPTFTNAGTIAKSAAGTAWITHNTTFSNQSGAINVSAGTLDIDSSGTSGDATFTVAAGAAVDITGNSTWNGTYTGSGAGSVVINSDAFTSINANGATFNFPAGMLNWDAGTISGQFTNLGDLTISGANPGSMLTPDVGGTLTNTGTIEVYSQLNLGAVLDNEAGGTITLEGNAVINGGDGTTFTNQGTLDKIGAGTSTINVGNFNNLEAPINVSAGSLVDNSGGASTGATFTVASGAEVDLTYTSSWSGNYTGSGGGLVVLEAPIFTYLNLDGATLNFPAGMLEWTTYTLEGNFTNLGSMTM